MPNILVMAKQNIVERCPHSMCHKLCIECIDAQMRYKNMIHHKNHKIAKILNSDKSFSERLDEVLSLEEF